MASSVGGGATAGPAQPADTTDPVRDRFLRRVLATSNQHDPIALQAQLELAAAVLGLGRCIDEVIIPTTRQLRGPTTTGHHDPARDVMATEAIRTWLNHRGLFAPAPMLIGPILLACGPRDRYLVELESLGVLLRSRRWPCRVLGARVSTFTLTVAARAADAAGVVVMSADGRARAHAVASLRAVDEMDIPVFFAGDAFDAELHRRGVPGRYLGTGLERACGVLIDSIALPV